MVTSASYVFERSNDPFLVVAERITGRDRWLLTLLYEHRVLTTDQITSLVFPNGDRARHRLVLLHRMGVVDRFRPLTKTGTAPYHYTVGPIGIEILASERDLDHQQLLRSRNRIFLLSQSQQLAHLIGVNGFFASLATVHRLRNDVHLKDWWSERQCMQKWGERVRPDGYGVLSSGGDLLPFFLEFDRGTETLSRVVTKLDAYRNFEFGTVLFWFPSAARERNFLARIRSSSVPFATANARDGSPIEQAWSSGPGGRVNIEEALAKP